MQATRIYHVAERAQSDDTAAVASGDYAPTSLGDDGFVHCSLWRQLPGVLTALFCDRADIHILEIDTSRLAAEVRFEDLYHIGDRYPHVYGSICRQAIRGELVVSWPVTGVPDIRRAGVASEASALCMDRAGLERLGEVVEMNCVLREDEGYADWSSPAHLSERMEGWLSTNHEAWIYTLAGIDRPEDRHVAGYALLDTGADPLLIRHLFVERGLRRHGVGHRAVELLLDHYRPTKVDVEALTGNRAAVRFWHKMGFANRSLAMRRAAGSPATPSTPATPATTDDTSEALGRAQDRLAGATTGDPPDAIRLRHLSGDTTEAAAFILENLQSFNDSVSPYHRLARERGGVQELAVMLEDASGTWVGGICGTVHWGWLDIDDLWVSEAYRGRGYGRRLLLELEARSVEMGAERAMLSTFSFQARGLYEKLGYRVVGEMNDLPPGGAMYWMRKDSLG